jgi:hypothetical protein
LALADYDAQDAFQRLNGADATVAPDPHDAAFIRFKAMMDENGSAKVSHGSGVIISLRAA